MDGIATLIPLGSLALAIGLLLVAIVRWKLHPFLALTIIALALGPAVSMTARDTVDAYLDGFGSTMRWIAVVMVLGSLLGEVLHEAGATMKISTTILRLVGARRLTLSMGLTGYVVSIPAFVDVAYIMLRPITESLAARSRRPILAVGLSLSAGLTASHALVPPTPGPLAAAGIIHADLGRMIWITGFVAVCAVMGGLAWATWYCGRVEIDYDRRLREQEASESLTDADGGRCPAWAAFLPILLPLALIAAGSFVGSREAVWADLVRFLGMPLVALLLGVAVALPLLPTGNRLRDFNRLLERSIERSAGVILITAAGGGFGGVIKAAGLGDQIAAMFQAVALPELLLPFLLAAALTTATGSLTVSMTTSASIMASLGESFHLSPEMTVALIGAGSLCVIHANASFFWLLSRLHEVRPDVLYRTYSAQSVCMACGGLAGAFVLWLAGVR